MAQSLVSLVDIRKEFAGVRALDGVSLDIGSGQVCCLVGENGSGKSTLIKVLAGVHAPDSGQIVIDGTARESLTPAESIAAGFQFIYQDFSLLPNLSVAENITFGTRVAGPVRWFSRAKARQDAAATLDRMRVSIDLDRPTGELPMVDRQLVAVAAALARDARLLVMDEPTTALSRREVTVLLEIIDGLRADGISTLFVSHKLDEVAAISDHTVVIRNGVKVADQPAGSLDRAALVATMTGREIDFGTHVAEPVRADAPVVLAVSRAGREGCFEEVDIEVREGEVFGITGLLGSGRDTLALALFGLLPMTSGKVSVDGAEVTLDSPRAAMAAGIGFVPEDRLSEGLFLDHSIESNIAVRLIDRLRTRAGLLDRPAVRRLAQEWVTKLSIKTSDVRRAVSTLSGGNQQRVVLAKWLSAAPRVLVLNGPTVGVDVGSKQEILQTLRELAAAGMAVIVISDDVPELLDVCHRIALMRDGRIVESYDRASLDERALNELLVAA